MVIDIISYTDEQYAALSKEQLLEIREAQSKKNKLDAALVEDLEKEKHRLIDNGIFFSEIWGKVQEKLRAEHARAVEDVRESLLFYLRFSASEDGGTVQSPYLVNYALSMEERFTIVKTYYEENFQTATARYDAFCDDEVAKVYLGELYAPLHDYFLGRIDVTA